MIFYRFHEVGGLSVVITNDITGANLPRIDNPWKAEGQTEVRQGSGQRFGVESGTIIEAIERDGYFVGSLRRS